MSAPTSAPTTKLNTSTLPHTLPSSSALPNNAQTTLTTALLSGGAIPRIERALTQSLAEAGWTGALRTQVAQLVRGGECASYADVLSRVLEGVRKGAGSSEIAVPEEVLGQAMKIVRAEVERCVEVRVDDVDD
jgi:hypothetical protein